MLTLLTVRNFIIIDEVSLSFPAGFIALTGETGAGKSILLDALDVALGGTVNATHVRQGEKRLEIEASFMLNDHHPAYLWLKQHELDDGCLCVLRRTFVVDGQARAYVNGISIRLSLLKELATLLVSIHSQHAQQELLKSNTAREFLDRYAHHQTYLDTLAIHYQQLKKLKQDYDLKFEEQKKNKEHEVLLRYQIEELRAENISDGEYQDIDKEYQCYAHAEKILGIGSQLDDIFNGDQQASLQQSITYAGALLRDLTRFDDGLQVQMDMLQQAQILLQEVMQDVTGFLQKVEVNPARKLWLEQRLHMFFQTSRKHHVKPEELFDHLKKLEDNLANIEHDVHVLHVIEQSIAAVQRDYTAVATELHVSREKAAKKLSSAVTKAMQTLAMPGGSFVVDVKHADEDTCTLYGIDHIEFLVAMNPGQALQPIAKVASGGELSRLSLILEGLFIEKHVQKTLIFDEVDTGIGGAVASIVGERLKRLASQQQVLCITHLPQVAVFANCQIEVLKITGKDESKLHVTILDESNRIQELARMLGGKHVNAEFITSAEKMLRLAQEESS